jgi:hypothetical protein
VHTSLTGTFVFLSSLWLRNRMNASLGSVRRKESAIAVFIICECLQHLCVLNPTLLLSSAKETGRWLPKNTMPVLLSTLRNHTPDYEKWRSTRWRSVSSGMLCRVALLRTDVSEELSASFIRVTRIGELGTTLVVTSNRRTLVFLRSVRRLLGTASVVPCSPILVTLMKEALSSPKTQVLMQYFSSPSRAPLSNKYYKGTLTSALMLSSASGVTRRRPPVMPAVDVKRCNVPIRHLQAKPMSWCSSTLKYWEIVGFRFGEKN